MLTRGTNSIISVFVLLIVAMMVIPLPPALLDVLIAVNFSMAIAILLLTMYTKEPLDFSVFPSLLLIMTLFRLSINVSSTRLILLRHNAGSIIEAFGQFVVDVYKRQPLNPEDMSLVQVVPAFAISELKTAFEIGFLLFLPFLVIDMVIASALMSMGMLMLPPVDVYKRQETDEGKRSPNIRRNHR